VLMSSAQYMQIIKKIIVDRGVLNNKVLGSGRDYGATGLLCT